MKYTIDSPPQPWVIDERFIPWPYEPFDERFYPKGGFIEDAILYMKGYETCNSFSFWSAVHAVSSIVGRDAGLRWAHGKLYPNFYIILVAPPGVVKKSTTVSQLDRIEFAVREKLKNENELLSYQKEACIIRGKATQESIFENMRSEGRTFKVDTGEIDDDGEKLFKRVSKQRNANLIMRISELSTFLSPSKYNVTLVDKITDFYDCKDRDSDTTIGRGNVELHNVFATLCGATTPDTFKTTIPKEAFGGGFISRCLVIREDVTPRVYPQPVSFPICPGFEEMAERLSWIAMHKRGEFVLSPEALHFYSDWYTSFKMDLREKITSGLERHIENRKDQHVLKLALIFALQRYDLTENIITVQDIKQAIRVIEHTIDTSYHEVEEAGMSHQGLLMNRIEQYIRAKGSEGVAREKILKSLGKTGVNSMVLNQSLDEFNQQGILTIRNERGDIKRSIGKASKEIYAIERN